MDDLLLTVLRGHNPWLDEPARQAALLAATVPKAFIPRRNKLTFQAGAAELIIGPRQAGKSTWIRQQLAQGSDPVLILHAEEARIRQLCGSPAAALNSLAGVLTERTILFLEEVQHLVDAPLFLKGLIDLQPWRRVVATGSASLQLRAQARESLAGRARRTRLLPLSLSEVGATLPDDLAPAIRELRLAELWQKLLVQGGYPAPWLAAEPVLRLHHLVEAFALRDASDLQGVERPAAFRKLLELAAADSGQLVNQSEWASVAQISRGTVARYLDVASDAHLLRQLQPFHGGRRAEVTGASKAYFIDNGFRNAIFGGFGAIDNRADRGALVDNAVYAELEKRCELLDDIRYWRTKNGAEVDFVVRRQQRMVAIEAKAGRLSRARISRAARSFIDAYQPACFAVINANLRDDQQLGTTALCFRRPWELAEVLARLDESF